MIKLIDIGIKKHQIIRVLIVSICFFRPLSTLADGQLSTDVLYAATLNSKEIASIGKKVLIKNPQAVFPDFKSNLDGEENIVNSVKQGFKIMHYDMESGGGNYGSGYFLTRLNEFDGSESASKYLQNSFDKVLSGLEDARELEGQTFGDETRYLMGDYHDNGSCSQFSCVAQFAFFRVNNITGYIRINTRTPLANRNISDYLANYVAAVSSKVKNALDGRLPPILIPPAIRDNLPKHENIVGLKILGVAASPAEAWANIDSSGDFTKVKKQLISGGAKTLGYQQYQILSNPSHIIEVTLFPFRSKKTALKWFDYSVGTSPGDLDTGNTGSESNFVSYKQDGVADSYEFMFAKGKIVADIYCYSVDGKTSDLCEKETRTLAEQWFSEIP